MISGLAALLALPLAVFFRQRMVTWGIDVLTLIWAVCTAMVTILLIWYALRGHVDHECQMIKSGWKCGGICGVIGLVLGLIIIPFIGSIVTGRDLPQAPLLGILITGPAGFSIGIIIGILISV